MFPGEIRGLVLSFVYAVGLLGLAELLYRKLDVPQFYTRKFVHIWAGMWVFATMMLFYRWEVGILPFAVFIVVNFLLYRFRLARSVDAADSTPGTVYFAIAITLLFALFWRPIGEVDHGPIAVAAVMAMTWGDAFAAIVGRSLGRHRYQVAGTERSYEGSATMFAVSFIAILLVLALLSASLLSPFSPALDTLHVLLGALLGAAVATVVEAVSPRGLDNLTVPLATAGVLWLIVR